MSDRISEKKGYALVTGASSGIGAAFARQLASMAYPLVLVARRKDRLEALAADIRAKHGVDVIVESSDLSQQGAALALFEVVQSKGINVQILINNAGVGIQGKFMQMELGKIDKMFHLNMGSLTELSQHFGREMVARGRGHILQVASMAAFLPSAYVAAYGATKAYVLAFSEALWYELKGTGVSVTTLYPGITTTEFNEVADAKTPPMMKMSILSPEKVARIGLKGMFRGKRAVVPGFINKVTAFFSRKMPRGMIVRSAGSMMRKANNQ